MSLELVVVKKEIGKLEINYDELVVDLELSLKDFKGLVVTEDAITQAKQTRANLNKVAKAIDDRRKELKKEILAPYEVVENQLKDLIKRVSGVVNEIDLQVKEFENKERDEKKEAIQKIWQDINFDQVDYIQLWDEKYLNKGFSLEKIKEDLESKVEDIKKNLNSIDLLVKDNNANLRIKAKYLQFLDLNRVLTEYEQEKTKEEMLRNTKVEEPKEEKEPVVETVREDEPTFVLQFEVKATRDDLRKLSEFLKVNNYEYKKL